MKKNGMRVTSLFLAAVMLASAPVTASAADTSANVEGEVVVDQTSQDQTSAESQNQAGQDQTSAEAQDQSQASAAEDAATGANSDNVTIQADDKPYLALGADLTDAQKNTVLSLIRRTLAIMMWSTQRMQRSISIWIPISVPHRSEASHGLPL